MCFFRLLFPFSAVLPRFRFLRFRPRFRRVLMRFNFFFFFFSLSKAGAIQPIRLRRLSRPTKSTFGPPKTGFPEFVNPDHNPDVSRDASPSRSLRQAEPSLRQAEPSASRLTFLSPPEAFLRFSDLRPSVRFSRLPIWASPPPRGSVRIKMSPPEAFGSLLRFSDPKAARVALRSFEPSTLPSPYPLKRPIDKPPDER